MWRNFDYLCRHCRRHVEILVEPGPIPTFPCECGGVLVQTWLKAPGMSPDVTPYFDQQLGVQINSRQQRDAMLKERGLVAMGPDESRWTESQAHGRSDDPIDHGRFREAAEKAWSDIENGRVPLKEAAPLPDHIDQKTSTIV